MLAESHDNRTSAVDKKIRTEVHLACQVVRFRQAVMTLRQSMPILGVILGDSRAVCCAVDPRPVTTLLGSKRDRLEEKTSMRHEGRTDLQLSVLIRSEESRARDHRKDCPGVLQF